VPTSDPRRRRRIITLLIAGTIALATFGVGIYGLVKGPAQTPMTPTNTHASTGGSGRTTTIGSPGGGPDPATLPKTDNAVTYAKAVAGALFDWSTVSGYMPTDYTAPVVADGDPSGQEIPGLITDVASYVPTDGEWTQLGTMNVVQTLTITSAAVPSLWPEALAEGHGQIPQGGTAINITGTRHRVGVWYGQKQVSNSPVSFTVFLVCSPTYSRCHTLRLSQLNDPLG
jgi:hypothetical protein